jgi:mannose-1-phosphate guanylyltransferase/mannose-6-phosphate isomerase
LAAFSATASSISRAPFSAVILAGGRGERLWPRARRRRPKPFVPLLGGASLFERTAARARLLAGARRVFVVCGAEEIPWVRRQTPWIPPARIVAEAIGRDTAASVALAALRLGREGEAGVMVVLPADHFVAPAGRFHADVRRAGRAAAARDALAILGIPPTEAATGYGYVRVGAAAGLPGVRLGAGFVEKPALARAARLAGDGRHLWNCGIFVGTPAVFLRELRRHAPRVLAPLERAAESAGRAWRVPARILRAVPRMPFDRAVLERTHHLLVVRATFRWSDLGTWSALAALSEEAAAFRRGEGRVILDASSTRCAAFNPGGLTAFVGVRDLVVVRDGSAVLVCHRGAAQRVREVARRLRGSEAS